MKNGYQNQVYYKKNSNFEGVGTVTDNFDKINNKI